MSELSRPRVHGPHRRLVVLLTGVAFTLSCFLAQDEAASDASFVNVDGCRSVLKRTKETRDDSLVARMQGWGWSRRPDHMKSKRRKMHPINRNEYLYENFKNMPYDMIGHFAGVTDFDKRIPWRNKDFSFTIKIGFEEGQDEVVTEEEVIKHFTSDDYAPVAVVVGHHTPHEQSKKTYVHFSCNEHATKAMEEKKDSTMGKAENIKLSLVHEKKWIRVRDGINMVGTHHHRQFFMKAYGDERYFGWQGGEKLPPVGYLRHPVYPEDDNGPNAWRMRSDPYRNLKGGPMDGLNAPWNGWTPRTARTDQKTSWGSDDWADYGGNRNKPSGTINTR